MRLILAGLLLSTSLLWAVHEAAPVGAAQGAASPPPNASVRMDVRAGFDGAGRVGGWIPLEVELVNEGGELRGEVQVVVQQGGGRGSFTFVPTTFTLPVVVPRLSHRRYTMDINLPTASNRVTARLVRSPSGDVVAEQDVGLARVPLGDYFCGILARDPSSYDFLAALDLPPPIRRVRTAPLEPASIPERAQLLGSFDCLIVDNASTAQLRQEQLDALQVWVGTGGLLLEVGGATYQSTLGPLPASLLPVELTGLASLPGLAALGGLMNAPLDGPGPWLVSQGRPRVEGGARVVAAQDGIPLIVAAKRGEGTVIYLAFEPTARALRAWSGNEQLWRYLITHAPVDNGIGSALVRPYLRWGRIPRLALADFSAQPKPSLTWLWLLTGTYGVTLAGGLALLRRRGLLGWSVLGVAGLAVGTTATALALAEQRAEPRVVVSRLTVVRPVEAGGRAAAYTREYLGILARSDGAFSFVLPADSLARGLFFPFPRPTDESDASWPLRVREGASPTLDRLELRQGKLATAVIDGQLRAAPAVETDLRLEGERLSGTVSNRSGGRLSDAFIVVDGQATPLGTLDEGQQRWVDVPVPARGTAGHVAGNALASRLTPRESAGRPGSAARRDLLESLFATRYTFGRMELRGPTLVGWLERSPATIDTPGVRMRETDLPLLVQPLRPLLPRGFEGEVPAPVMSRRDLGIGSGTLNEREYWSIGPGEAVTLQYSMPPSDGRFQFQQLRVSIEGELAGRGRAPKLPFTVSLYNWRAAEWQGWEVHDGTSIIPGGERYISAAGDVRLRYTLDASLGTSVREARITRLDVTPVGVVQ